MATIDGNAAFGLAVHMNQNPHPTAQQLNEFFGVNGILSVFGGSRGRTFLITGVLVGPDIPTINALESNLLSYADGNAHTLVDDRGREWDNVVFMGEYQPFEEGPRLLAGGGYGLPYKLVMTGLT